LGRFNKIILGGTGYYIIKSISNLHRLIIRTPSGRVYNTDHYLKPENKLNDIEREEVGGVIRVIEDLIEDLYLQPT